MARISGYELFGVPPRWLFLRVETADGLVGWGIPTLTRRPQAARGAVADLMDNYLVGSEAGTIEDHWQTMYRSARVRGGPVLMSALSGIDQALWDIKGKRFGAPVHELLGGAVRDRVQLYQWVGGDHPPAVADEARSMVDAGYTALKMDATGRTKHIDTPGSVDAAVDRIREVREAVGEEVDIAVDFHGRVSKSMAKRLVEAFEPFRPMFIEEPVLPENNETLPWLARRTDVPIATGERMYSRWDFKHLLEGGGVDVVQPDVCHAGGITEVRKIATMAAAYDIAVSPHCPQDPISYAACLQVDACCHNALIQPQDLDVHLDGTTNALSYLEDPDVFAYEDGYVTVPDGPGLGIEIDESYVREQAEKNPDWHNPIWRHEDGSIAEW